MRWQVVSLFSIAALFWASYWSLRLAWADRLSRSSELEGRARAVRLAPGNAEFRIRWADLLERAGQDPTPILESAVTINPNQASIWMEMGVRAEMNGDLFRAERCLLEAARVSKHFQPRWTLANYYFRALDPDKFWPWAKEALRMTYGDPKPLFQLCWRMSEDSQVILNRAIPDRPPILGQYLDFLISDDRLAEAEPVARQLLGHASLRSDAVPVLLAYCNRLLDARLVDPALRIWNSLCAKKFLPYNPLDAEHGNSLTNGDFRSTPRSGGFDWRIPSSAGISVARLPSAGCLRVAFSGKQAESCEPLNQFLPLVPGRSYRLVFQYQMSETAAESGLRWRVFDATTGSELPARSPQLSSRNWKEEEAVFLTPPGVRLARLALSYHRAPGTTRMEGSVSFRRVSFGLLQ